MLVLHGMIHLAGYDHETDQGQMQKLESTLRRRLGLLPQMTMSGLHARRARTVRDPHGLCLPGPRLSPTGARDHRSACGATWIILKQRSSRDSGASGRQAALGFSILFNMALATVAIETAHGVLLFVPQIFDATVEIGVYVLIEVLLFAQLIPAILVGRTKARWVVSADADACASV